MRASPVRWHRALVVVLALGAAACGGPSAAPPSAGPEPSAVSETEALYRARMDSARSRFTEADVHFMTGMIAHHAQALEMAALAPDRGASPAVQTLAARIINGQKDEIATMQTWLRDRGQPVPEVHVMDGQLMVHGADHAVHMPGMLSPEQMRQLEAARGAEFDRLFLTYMIQHHQGAVGMVHELFGTGGAGQDEDAFRLASDVQVDQITEIARMERMLSAMTDHGGRP